ncbi:SDR family NAD(P)-dependent oxidoreductase [Pantoea sp. Tr-811]|uniref:SDR family NAD(P)-dependent oxidoreductase n=1 Tax=Pantoea sp. Tr-811 TaxID=2608361 RepID=UPI00141DED4E|nr:SDR family NAD(P)-dependent oxidoreductase [Pantoea sp. Tr-811]NIF29769.1 SDR family NAD(P)-dependent oxidoreductase [Pantoea sp. Tr-811]
MKCWFITGVSRGFGLALAKAALANGDKVIGTVRSEAPTVHDPEGRLRVLKVDMNDDEGVSAAVHQAFETLGRIDVLVNNAGYGVLGPIESSTDDDLHKLFQVNVFAPIRIIRTALPYLRRQKGGHIVNISSISGRAPGVGAGLYAATKFALEGFTATLAREVEPFGIKVTAVAPGQFRTDFLDAKPRQADTADAAYGATVGAALDALYRLNHLQQGDPERAAQAILKAVAAEQPPLQLLLGADAVERARAKMRAVEEEMVRWEDVSSSTGFREAPSSNKS